MDSSSIRLFFGLSLTIWGVSIMVNKDHRRKVVKDTAQHSASHLIFALIPLIIGSYTVAVHNIWALDDRRIHLF